MNINMQKQVRRHVTDSLVKGSRIRDAFTMIADDSDDDENKMKVLIDGDGMKLLMQIYGEYISEESYIDYIKFAKDVDKLLLKYRGGKPLSREERDAYLEDSAPKKRNKKKKAVSKPASENTEQSSNTEVTSSDVPKAISYFINKSRQDDAYRV